jgi:Raf kinase inhibitor-like YbhB/YbcL family protein
LQLSVLSITVLVALVLASCGGEDSAPKVFDPASSVITVIEFSSPAFGDGEPIPMQYTCDGDDMSPPLRWSDVPAGTRSISIILDDPDAPGSIFRHWSLYDLPSATRSLKEAQPTSGKLQNSTRQGKNDFDATGYRGPCPPRGEEHEYLFFIYALSEPLKLGENATPSEVSNAIRGRVLGTGSFTGMYARQ